MNLIEYINPLVVLATAIVSIFLYVIHSEIKMATSKNEAVEQILTNRLDDIVHTVKEMQLTMGEYLRKQQDLALKVAELESRSKSNTHRLDNIERRLEK